jgi:ATP-dependent Clp protease ATP-binding subunit ClpC
MKLLSKWNLLVQCSRAGMVRYTDKARRTVFYAGDLAIQDMSNEVTPKHLLLGLLRADESLLVRLGIRTIDSIRSEVAEFKRQGQSAPALVLSEAARNVIALAAEEREHFLHKHTGTEHLLLGIIRAGSDAAKFLQQKGATVDRLRQLLNEQKLTEWRTAESLCPRPAN